MTIPAIESLSMNDMSINTVKSQHQIPLL